MQEHTRQHESRCMQNVNGSPCVQRLPARTDNNDAQTMLHNET